MSSPMPKQGEFCWNELMTGNPDKAKAFYSSLLGWQYDDIDIGCGTYSMLKSGDKEIGGMMKIPQDKADTIPPHWMSYIMVEDVEEVMAKAKSLGATIKCPVTDVANQGRFIVVEDPTGAHIAFWQSTQKS